MFHFSVLQLCFLLNFKGINHNNVALKPPFVFSSSLVLSFFFFHPENKRSTYDRYGKEGLSGGGKEMI